MAVITINTDTYLTSNLAADSYTIIEGATLYIDAATWTTRNTFGGTFTCISEGRLRLQNDTNDIMVVEMGSFNYDFRFEANGVFEIAGQLVEIYTGTGASGQTIDFTTLGGDYVNWPSCVWVEIDGELTPFINLGDTTDALPLPLAGTSGQAGIGQTGFGGVAGSLEMGRFFNFNESTGVATFGNGTNGAVIPNGAKVYFPNIHVTSQKQTTMGSKTTFDFNPTGTMVFENVNFSRDINPAIQTSYQIIDFSYVGCCNFLGGITSAGPITYDHVVLCPITDSVVAGSNGGTFSITSVAGAITIDHLYIISSIDSTTSTRSIMSWSNNPNISKYDNFYLNLINKRSSTSGDNARHTFGTLSNISGVDLNNWTLIGGAVIAFSVVTNCTMRNWRFSATPFALATSTPNTKWLNATGGIVSINNTDTIKMTRWRLCDQGVPNYGVFLGIAANSKFTECYDIVYPSEYNGVNFIDYIMILQSPNFIMKNCTFGVVRNASGFFVTPSIAAANVVLENIRGHYGATAPLILTNGTQANFVSGVVQSTGLTGAFDMGPFFLAYSSSNQTTGTDGTIMAQFQPDNQNDASELSGSAYYNNAGRLYLPKVNSQAIIQSVTAIRGVTSLKSNPLVVSPTTMANLTNYSWEFEFANWGDNFLGNWTALTSFSDLTVLVNAFDALTDYDANIGFKMRWRVTALIASTSNYTNGWRFECNVDADWTAYDAYITFEGGSPTDKYEMRLLSDSSLVTEFIGVGRHDFTLGDLGGLVVYFVRYVLVDGVYERTSSTKPTPITLVYGNNGNILLYVGSEVQVASNDIAAIWAYADRSLTEGFNSTDRAQLNKTLTSGKFLALK